MTSLLRPRLATIAAAPRCIRWFSASRARRSGQLTIAIPPSTSKKSVLDELRSRREALGAHDIAPAPSFPDNAAVVLASPEFATWLEDEAFMSGLLQGLPLATDAPEGVRVLAAVVAALAPPAQAPTQAPAQTQTPLSGLSVLYGNADSLLPYMRHPDHASTAALRSSRGSIGSDIDRDAAITVQVPSLGSSASPLCVTLPLANTIFQNGRRSTLLASSWHAAHGPRSLRLTALDSHEHDLVIPPVSSAAPSAPASSSSVSALLFPIAEPLTIAAGLGNIVRQVFDPAEPAHTKPIPAARELEAAIPALLAARKRSNPALQDGAMSVWALVVPAPLVPLYTQLKQQTRPALDALSSEAGAVEHTAAVEQQAAALASEHFTTLLAAGCRLHKILSGGGGWGLKQGLLSLDPQMSHPAAVLPSRGTDNSTTKILGEERRDDEMDDEAMLSFIRSFKSETSVGRQALEEEAAAALTADGAAVGAAGAADSVAMPGAVVQFFVAPLESQRDGATLKAPTTPTAPTVPTAPTAIHSITLGAQTGYDGSSSTAGSPALAFIHNHFGAVSNHGIFLASSDASSSASAIRSKLDPPHAHVSYSGVPGQGTA